VEAGPGPGRRRPWRLVNLGLTMDAEPGNAEMTVAFSCLERLMVGRYLERLETWIATRNAYPADWQLAAGQSEFLVYVTPAELKAIRDEFHVILDRHRERLVDRAQRPEGLLPVEVLAFTYPIREPVGASG
jgi:hypothetical protein